MKSLKIMVLLFCLVTYGYGRPSDADENEENIRGSKRTKHFQHDNVDELSEFQTESPTTENVMNRLKSIAHLRIADTRKPNVNSITREELEALKDLLDKNLQKYQNYNEHSVKRRPNDPYIGQILQNLNGDQPNLSGDNINSNKIVEQQSAVNQMPIRRKIIRHTVFATPLQDGSGAHGLGGVGNSNFNRFYGGDSRIDWSSPWANYFPILIKDPLQTMMNSFSEIIEYGPAADICRHAAVSGDEDTNRVGDDRGGKTLAFGGDDDRPVAVRPDTLKRSRRNTAGTMTAEDENIKGVLNHVRPFRPMTTTTEQPKMHSHWAPDKQAAEHNGDTGPQIKRLVVRRGGVAIAGPGGIATAGSGGTAIVGPGGSAYSSKDSASGTTADVPPMTPGISMAGYGPQMVQAPPGYFAAYPHNHNGFGRSADGGTAVLSSNGVAYSFPVPSRGLTAAADDENVISTDVKPYASSTAREIRLPDGAKLIATGPIVYYNPEPSQSVAATVPVMRKRSHKGKKTSSNYRRNTKKERELDNEQWF